jgi:hypothetical protein
MIYGFLSQTIISVMGKSYYVTLIARRSKHFAGTRFLKRASSLRYPAALESLARGVSGDINRDWR